MLVAEYFSAFSKQFQPATKINIPMAALDASIGPYYNIERPDGAASTGCYVLVPPGCFLDCGLVTFLGLVGK